MHLCLYCCTLKSMVTLAEQTLRTVEETLTLLT
jgi:hypothetical protein